LSSMLVKGIVVREVMYSDYDKILTVLTRDHGLITISAKSARRPGRNMLLSTSVLSFSEFEISGSESTRYFLKSANVIESFQKIRTDVVLLTYCAHLLDLVLDSMHDVSSADDIYTLLLYTLYTISKENADFKIIIHTFELKLLFVLGFMPVLDVCAECSKDLKELIANNETFIFSFTQCGLCCENSACIPNSRDYIKISKPTLQCIIYIAESTYEKLYSFKLEKCYANELAALSTRYICERLDRCYTKLNMLDDIGNFC
jgi:DNA repair protein RecO (recombination protein O)